MKDKIKVGISGLGRSGWGIHANRLSRRPNLYGVVAVFDPLEERRREAAERFGCKTYVAFDSLIEDDEVELLVIATPSYLHAPQTIKALKAGKNVVVEKPMAATLHDADSMIEAAKETEKVLTIFQSARYSQSFQKVQEVIKSGKLGRIVLIKMYKHSFRRRWDWQTLKKFGGGELRNSGVHIIDQALQLFGPEKPEVFCDLQRAVTLGDAEDHVKVVLKASESPTIDIETSRTCAYPQDSWLIMGTQGGLTGSHGSLKWKYFNPKDLPPRQVDERPTLNRSYNTEVIPWKEETWEGDREHRGSGPSFYGDLYETLRNGDPLKITPESVRRVMWVIEECFRQTEK